MQPVSQAQAIRQEAFKTAGQNQRKSSRAEFPLKAENSLAYMPVDTGTLVAGIWGEYDTSARLEKMVYSLKVRKAIVYKLKVARMPVKIQM